MSQFFVFFIYRKFLSFIKFVLEREFSGEKILELNIKTFIGIYADYKPLDFVLISFTIPPSNFQNISYTG